MHQMHDRVAVTNVYAGSQQTDYTTLKDKLDYQNYTFKVPVSFSAIDISLLFLIQSEKNKCQARHVFVKH